MLVFYLPNHWRPLHLESRLVEVAEGVSEGDNVVPITTEQEDLESSLKQLGDGEIAAFYISLIGIVNSHIAFSNGAIFLDGS